MSNEQPNEPKPVKNANPVAWLALVIAVAALVAGAYPPIQHAIHDITAPRAVPQAAAPDIVLSAHIEQRLTALEAAQNQGAASVPNDQTTSQISAMQEQLNTLASSAANQEQKLNTANHLPAALALVRVEERFERGQDFSEALALLNRILLDPLSDSDAQALTDAATGVPPTNQLMADLDKNERALRRELRLAAVSSPIDRIWAELRSLVLVRTTTVADDDTVGQSLAAIKNAINAGDAAAFAKEWGALSPAIQAKLATWHADVQRRLVAHAVLQQLTQKLLLPNATHPTAGGQEQ
jgi:hypothetical protein